MDYRNHEVNHETLQQRENRASKLERPPFYEVQRKAFGSRESQAMLIVTDSESKSSTK